MREGQAFRIELVEAARALFVEDGFDAVSIRKITERAGCSPMTFYVYFRNRRELLRHIWEDVLAVADAHAAKAAAVHEQPASQLGMLARAWTEYWVENPDNFRIVFLNQDRLASEDDVYFTRSSRTQQFTLLVETIKRGIADTSFRKADPLTTAQALLTTCIGLASGLILAPEMGWRDGLIGTSIDLFIRGLSAQPLP